MWVILTLLIAKSSHVLNVEWSLFSYEISFTININIQNYIYSSIITMKQEIPANTIQIFLFDCKRKYYILFTLAFLHSLNLFLQRSHLIEFFSFWSNHGYPFLYLEEVASIYILTSVKLSVSSLLIISLLWDLKRLTLINGVPWRF